MLIQQTDLPAAIAVVAAAWLSFYTRKLTLSAAITGFICAMIIYLATGYTGLLLLAAFFISGTVATALGRRDKQKLARSGDSSQRKYKQVLANGGPAALAALLILILPAYKSILLLMLAATLASATADTLSSELGMLYGKKFYNCISFKKDLRGLDGVISLEGTLIGAVGAMVIALLYSTSYCYPLGFSTIAWHFLMITGSGVIGNFSDSVLGATLERRNLLGNDAVNFLSTTIAGITAYLFYVSFLLF